MDISPLRFDDLAPIEETVSIGGREYVLREISGENYVVYQNERNSRFVYDDGKLVQVKDIADLEPLLVSLCMFENDGRTPVNQGTILGWPGRVLRALHDRAKELSGLTEPIQTLESTIKELQDKLNRSKAREGRGKNSPSATRDGSASPATTT